MVYACFLKIFLHSRQKLSIMLLFSDGCAVSTRNSLTADSLVELVAMTCNAVYLCYSRNHR
ncbi:hypothetical protein NC652_025744 [Populus alba x Populus x berolinensis]|nr:hypothetical protein NC652_025744 [Populus alba x Populus x berolinensis]